MPKLDKNEILVKVAYVSQNPTDWKHSAFLSPPNVVIGCDYSGVVVQLGEGLANGEWKVGDHIAGMVHGGKFTHKGSFAGTFWLCSRRNVEADGGGRRVLEGPE